MHTVAEGANLVELITIGAQLAGVPRLVTPLPAMGGTAVRNMTKFRGKMSFFMKNVQKSIMTYP